MSLYIGTNYHPHDWSEERWSVDIQMMKEAGFTTVRLGHLCWDSYEPDNGVYTFDWFDKVMDLFAEAGIGVVLDISMRPAPIWVHQLCRGVNLGGINGDLQYPVRRYMDDVSDPEYQLYALRFAEKLVNRYKDHPAMMAFGLCNELGSGRRSLSEESRQRYIEWLKRKYGTIENLNKAWSSQRWCRKLLSFEQTGFPETEKEVGSPEAWLDMRRFFSDGVGDFISQLQRTVKFNAPNLPTTSNHYAEKQDMGFDYLHYYPQFVEYPGVGYYVNFRNEESYQRINFEITHRVAETDRPMWCIEFQTGSYDIHHGKEGLLRMVMMHCLLHRTQMILGWTWRTMLAGEEQFLIGMCEHDGLPNENYEVYKKVAAEFKKLEKYAFPYVPIPEIAVCQSYDNDWINQYPNNRMFRHEYAGGCMPEVSRTFRDLNRDYNIIDLKNPRHDYKLIVIPEYAIITKDEADYVRRYVAGGGNVIMTGYSAILNEHGSAYDVSQPAGLSDVFGIRVCGFVRPTEKEYYENIELHSAELLYGNEESVGQGKAAKRYGRERGTVSVNHYGKGRAYYMVSEMDHRLMTGLISGIADEIGLSEAVEVPSGVQARRIAKGQYFYVNTTEEEKAVILPGRGRRVLGNEEVSGTMLLKGFDADLILTEE